MPRILQAIPGNTRPMQKTWTQLLGEYQQGDDHDGRMLVRPLGQSRYRVLWIFETEEQAQGAFEEWRRSR